MSIFLSALTKEMNKIKNQGDRTIEQLSTEQMHWSPSEQSNNVAILIQHIAGNMLSRSTDFLTTDGEKPWRNRNEEFVDQQLTKEELLKIWEEAWAVFFETVAHLSEEDLFHAVTVKNNENTATAALMTQLVHYSGHIAQMIYIGKLVVKEDWLTIAK